MPANMCGRVRLAAASFVLAVSTSGYAADPTFPNRPVRLIAGSPGSTADLSGRYIAQKLSERWGRQVVVDNRGSAGGIVGGEIVARAPPDGHTLFMSGIRSQLAHYSTGHSVNTINRGFEHLWRMGEYFTIVLLSPYAPIAFAWSALAVVGAVSLWRQSSRLAAIVLTFPVLYIAYFSLQRVMIVRNLLIVAPFIAWLAARGARVPWDALGRTRAPYAVRFVFATVIAAALGANVVWDVRSVDTIRARSPQRTGHEFAEWLRTRQPGTVWLAPSLSADVRATEAAIAAPRERATALAFSASDPLLANVPANRRGLFAAVFGPREVNLDYYPNWIGDEHIVVLSAERARELGIR